MTRKTVIFDLDGTLALIDARRKISERGNGKINWGKFFDPKNIELDLPNWPVIEMFDAMKSRGHKVVIFSGRSDATREATESWLDLYGIQPDMLVMRDSSNEKTLFMPDDQLKLGWLNEHFPNKEQILCVFDDRDKVVKMWRDNGISCFQVNYGNF